MFLLPVLVPIKMNARFTRNLGTPLAVFGVLVVCLSGPISKAVSEIAILTVYLDFRPEESEDYIRLFMAVIGFIIILWSFRKKDAKAERNAKGS